MFIDPGPLGQVFSFAKRDNHMFRVRGCEHRMTFSSAETSLYYAKREET